MMNRRQFLSASAALSTLAAGRLYAGPVESPRFLLVFLRGGYDCANVLIPYSSDFYYEARPHIAVAKPDAAIETGALELDANWALTPALRETIGKLYEQRRAAFIPFSGTDDLSRSHFETQDSIEMGQATQGGEPSSSQVDYHSGFLGRLSTVLTGARPIAFTDSLPLIFRGNADIPNVSLKGVGKPSFDQRQSAILASMYADHHLSAAVTDGLELRQQVAQAMADEMVEANRGAITTKGFELEAGRMAKLLREQYRIGFIDVGGWDTHVNEGGVQGTLANNLQNLGKGLQTFSEAMGTEWKNTVVVVISEFGRTFRENGNGGTDHGHGSVYWVLGGDIDGGRIAGEQVAITRSTLFQNRDYPVLNDYRAILGGLFGAMWDLEPDDLTQIFPGVPPRNLRLI